MRHVKLTCKHHPQLRWSCKSIAFSPGRGYNGQRNIFFFGQLPETKAHPDAPELECQCPLTDLVLAPEDPWHSLPLEDQRKAINEDVG